MDKMKHTRVQSFKQSVFARHLLISCLGLGLTACSDTAQTQFGPYAQGWQNAPLIQGAVYFPQQRQQAAHVRVAQNHAVPGLRGPSHVRKAILQQYHFDDQPKFQSVSPGVPARSNTPDPRQFFQHQLEEAAPRRIVTPAPAPVQTHQPAPAQTYQSAPAQAQVQAPVSRPVQAPVQARTYQPAPQPAATPAPQPVYVSGGTSLTQSLDTAVNQSSRLAIEDIRVQEAEESLEQARAQGRFKLALDSSLGAGEFQNDFRVVDRDESDFRVSRTANLGLSLPIYQGGRINAQKDLAKGGINTAKANYNAVESQVAEQAGIAHMDVLRDRALVDVYRRNVELLHTQSNTVQTLLGAGENTVTDKALVDARLAAIQVRLKQAESNLVASESRYKKLTGYAAPALSSAERLRLPASLQDAKEAAFSNNPQLQARQSEADAAVHNIRVAKSLSRPQLALQGNLRAAEGLSDTIRRSSAAEVLLNLSVPILSGGENKSRVRQAALAQSRSALETRALQEDLNERLEQLWATAKAAKQSQAPNLAQRTAAEQAYQAILKQRKAGVATSLDVLSVEQTLLDSELNIIQAENDEAVAKLQILALMGAI